jgi:dTDP-4-dehydrorhamnose 3,5-epimerase-like enzyme
MAHIISVPAFSDHRGSLHVLEGVVPFDIKRVYFIHGVPGYPRGGHRHKKSIQALVCVSGSCLIYNHNGQKEEEFLLDSPDKCLLLQPEDWHIMKDFSHDAVLLVLSSTPYDINDYIDTPYS